MVHQPLDVQRAILHGELGHFSLLAQVGCKQANPINWFPESYLVAQDIKCSVIDECVAGIIHREALLLLFQSILSVTQQP